MSVDVIAEVFAWVGVALLWLSIGCMVAAQRAGSIGRRLQWQSRGLMFGGLGVFVVWVLVRWLSGGWGVTR